MLVWNLPYRVIWLFLMIRIMRMNRRRSVCPSIFPTTLPRGNSHSRKTEGSTRVSFLLKSKSRTTRALWWKRTQLRLLKLKNQLSKIHLTTTNLMNPSSQVVSQPSSNLNWWVKCQPSNQGTTIPYKKRGRVKTWTRLRSLERHMAKSKSRSRWPQLGKRIPRCSSTKPSSIGHLWRVRDPVTSTIRKITTRNWPTTFRMSLTGAK